MVDKILPWRPDRQELNQELNKWRIWPRLGWTDCCPLSVVVFIITMFCSRWLKFVCFVSPFFIQNFFSHWVQSCKLTKSMKHIIDIYWPKWQKKILNQGLKWLSLLVLRSICLAWIVNSDWFDSPSCPNTSTMSRATGAKAMCAKESLVNMSRTLWFHFILTFDQCMFSTKMFLHTLWSQSDTNWTELA